MPAVAVLNSPITSDKSLACPLESKKLMPKSFIASAAPFVFVDNLVNIELSAVPAIVPLIPVFAIKPVIRATSSME